MAVNPSFACHGSYVEEAETCFQQALAIARR
jgi:hypothetical protein